MHLDIGYITLRLAVVLAVCCGACAACSDSVSDIADTEGDAGVPMRVVCAWPETRVDADTDYGHVPTLLFWNASSILSQGVTTYTAPFYVTAPPDELSYIGEEMGASIFDADTWFNTGCPYPDNNDMALASGYYPTTVEHTDDYRTLTVPRSMLATDTLRVARGAILGSSYRPFSDTLKFVYAHVRLVFLAQLADDMSRLIRNVTVSAPDLGCVLYRMRWQRDANDITQSGYQALDFEAADTAAFTEAERSTLRQRLTTGPGATTGFLPPASHGNPDTVGCLYVRPDLEGITLNISASMYRTSTDRAPEDYVVRNFPVRFTNVQLMSGDSYTLLISFNLTEIEMSGQKEAFVNGGNIAIPIQPFY